MKNTFGQNITVTLFGESHGQAIGAVIDGLAPGLPIDTDFIAHLLSRRRPSSSLDTGRREPDEFHMVSGVFQGKTTGTPICILIPNQDTKSGDYDKFRGLARPSHADYTAYCKYHGFEDYRGGGHFSGRITAALVAVGGILIPALRRLGISIGTHILECGGISDRTFENMEKDIETLNSSSFPVLDPGCIDKMSEVILNAKRNLDSVGGIVQTAILGLPAGLGEPWFDTLEGLFSHAMFSLGGIKGIEFGDGFAMSRGLGSTCNDAFRMENGKVVTKTNHNGGINGGISNGMPVIFNCAVKPTPSIAQKQETIQFIHRENADIAITGRHDPAIVRRVCPVIDCVSAIVLCDVLAGRYGTDVFTRGIDQ